MARSLLYASTAMLAAAQTKLDCKDDFGEYKFELQKQRAIDVDFNGGKLWVVGTKNSRRGKGNYLYYQKGESWRRESRSGGFKVAVNNDGNPFQVDKNGLIHQKSGRSWVSDSQNAIDIAIGSEGSMYALVGDMSGEGYDLYYREGSRSWESFSDKRATSVTVDNQGNPWITNNKNQIWKWTAGQWEYVKGRASKIEIGADGSIFALDDTKDDAGFGIWKLNQQNNKWMKVGSGAKDITVGDDGKPYIISATDKLMWPEDACPGDWGGSGGQGDRQLQITIHVKTPMNWNDAHAYCQSQGGNLASYRSQTELDKIVKYANTCEEDSFYWVGANDKEREGKWIWTDDKSTLDFAGWAEDEPNNEDDEEHCGALETEDAAMYDADCSAELFFACQRPLRAGEELAEPDCPKPLPPPPRKDFKITHESFCSDEKKTGGNDLCGCTGKIIYGTWKSIMLDTHQRVRSMRIRGQTNCSWKVFGKVKGLENEDMQCYCEGVQTTPVIKKPKAKPNTGLNGGTPMKVAWDFLEDGGAGRKVPFKHVKSKTRKWRALTPSQCSENSKCKGTRLSGKYTIRTDSTGFSKIMIEGELRSKGNRNKNVEMGLFTAMSTKSGGSQWSALQWDPNNRKWASTSSYNKCSLDDMENCAKKLKGFKFDKTWTAGLTGDVQRKTQYSVKFQMVRDFDNNDKNLQLKLGEFYNFRAGFVEDKWNRFGMSKDIVMCLSDDDKKKCQDYVMEGNEVQPVTFVDTDPAPTTKPAKRRGKKNAFKWTGLRSGAECDVGSKCAGYSMNGRYRIARNADGERVLQLNGIVQWRSGGRRDRDMSFGVVTAMTTNNGESEWAAQNWDPNGGNWLFYSSYNECSINRMQSCAEKVNGFYWDTTWQSNGIEEGVDSVRFSFERKFKHSKSKHRLRLNDIRKMKVGIIIGEWEIYGFSKPINICLKKDGSKRQCGRKMHFEIKDPTPLPPTLPTGPTLPDDFATNSWTALVDADCEGNDEKCTGVNYKGKYIVETDPNGDHRLTITGSLSWEGLPRNIDKAFGMFIGLSRPNGETEWSAQNWDPNGNIWRPYSSTNKCPISKFRLCSKQWRAFYFDKSWQQDQIKEKSNSLYFSTSRPFKHKQADRVLKLGEVRQLRAGFLIGMWKKGNWGYSPTMNICLSDNGDCAQWEESSQSSAQKGDDWEPPSEDEFYTQEWDAAGHPIVSDEEWEDWEEDDYEIPEEESEVSEPIQLVKIGEKTKKEDEDYETWEDDEEFWMQEIDLD